MSSEIYELMKRSDEGAVVEKAHRRPRFVEDCVREMIRGVVEDLPELGDDALRLRPPGEPRDDPPAQRRGRALRHAGRAAPGAAHGRAVAASHVSMREWLDAAGALTPKARNAARPGIEGACPRAAWPLPSSPASPPPRHRPPRRRYARRPRPDRQRQRAGRQRRQRRHDGLRVRRGDRRPRVGRAAWRASASASRATPRRRA